MKQNGPIFKESKGRRKILYNAEQFLVQKIRSNRNKNIANVITHVTNNSIAALVDILL